MLKERMDLSASLIASEPVGGVLTAQPAAGHQGPLVCALSQFWQFLFSNFYNLILESSKQFSWPSALIPALRINETMPNSISCWWNVVAEWEERKHSRTWFLERVRTPHTYLNLWPFSPDWPPFCSVYLVLFTHLKTGLVQSQGVSSPTLSYYHPRIPCLLTFSALPIPRSVSFNGHLSPGKTQQCIASSSPSTHCLSWGT